MDQLSNEILLEIFYYIPHKDIFNYCLYVNKTWHFLIKALPNQYWIDIISKELSFLDKYTLIEIDGFGYLLLAQGIILSFGNTYHCTYVEKSMKFRDAKTHLVEDISRLYQKFGSRIYGQIIRLNKIILNTDGPIITNYVVKISNYINPLVLIESFNLILKADFRKIIFDNTEYNLNQMSQCLTPIYIGKYECCSIE